MHGPKCHLATRITVLLLDCIAVVLVSVYLSSAFFRIDVLLSSGSAQLSSNSSSSERLVSSEGASSVGSSWGPVAGRVVYKLLKCATSTDDDDNATAATTRPASEPPCGSRSSHLIISVLTVTGLAMCFCAALQLVVLVVVQASWNSGQPVWVKLERPAAMATIVFHALGFVSLLISFAMVLSTISSAAEWLKPLLGVSFKDPENSWGFAEGAGKPDLAPADFVRIVTVTDYNTCTALYLLVVVLLLMTVCTTLVFIPGIVGVSLCKGAPFSRCPVGGCCRCCSCGGPTGNDELAIDGDSDDDDNDNDDGDGDDGDGDDGDDDDKNADAEEEEEAEGVEEDEEGDTARCEGRKSNADGELYRGYSSFSAYHEESYGGGSKQRRSRQSSFFSVSNLGDVVFVVGKASTRSPSAKADTTTSPPSSPEQRGPQHDGRLDGADVDDGFYVNGNGRGEKGEGDDGSQGSVDSQGSVFRTSRSSRDSGETIAGLVTIVDTTEPSADLPHHARTPTSRRRHAKRTGSGSGSGSGSGTNGDRVVEGGEEAAPAVGLPHHVSSSFQESEHRERGEDRERKRRKKKHHHRKRGTSSSQEMTSQELNIQRHRPLPVPKRGSLSSESVPLSDNDSSDDSSDSDSDGSIEDDAPAVGANAGPRDPLDVGNAFSGSMPLDPHTSVLPSGTGPLAAVRPSVGGARPPSSLSSTSSQYAPEALQRRSLDHPYKTE